MILSNNFITNHFFIEILLSQEKPSTMSSAYGSYQASFCFDGNLDQVNNFAHSAEPGNDEWIQVDLENTPFITRVIIYNRKKEAYFDSRLNTVTIDIADSADMTSNKRLCASFSVVTDLVTQIENLVCSSTMVGRYVRLTQHNDLELHICEMQVYGFYQ